MSDKYQALRLENQLCFPLYAAAKKIVGRYKPLLDEVDLTYTQYIAMMALWQHDTMSVKDLGDLLHLDSGTLTPLLKRLEGKGYISRARSKTDERVVEVSLTTAGQSLEDKAAEVPPAMAQCLPLNAAEAKTLYDLLYKILNADMQA